MRRNIDLPLDVITTIEIALADDPDSCCYCPRQKKWYKRDFGVKELEGLFYFYVELMQIEFYNKIVSLLEEIWEKSVVSRDVTEKFFTWEGLKTICEALEAFSDFGIHIPSDFEGVDLNDKDKLAKMTLPVNAGVWFNVDVKDYDKFKLIVDAQKSREAGYDV